MPPRLSRASLPSTSNKKSRKKTTKRALDAYSIAAAENPDSARVRKHRLGDIHEARAQNRKRVRDEEDDDKDLDDEDAEETERPRPRKRRNRDDSDVDEGSDSEGNTWQMGHVDEEDDSDIDSDEAFGESDEERFEGFTFRGSQGEKKKKSVKKRKGEDEDLLDEEEDEAEESDESLGEDAVDLATMLDNYEDSEDDQEKPGKRKKASADGMAVDSEGDDGSLSDSSPSRDGEEEDPQQLVRLQDLITSLQPDDTGEMKKRGIDGLESTAPSDSATLHTQRIELEDLLPTIASSQLKKAAKIFREDAKPSKSNGIPAKVEVPLPKRQQDRLDRVAANQKVKETLERWVDTVKQNRRAEHISFPLKYGDETELQGSRRLLPTSAPQNDLESTINKILVESGLVTKNGHADEEKIREFEELETKKIPVEELEARRAELRKARELLFREEVRAKRVKKIKSKAYRRHHRKERQKLEEKERALLLAEGVDLSEEERELNDRRRAEERMGAKHRESKWAKGVKKSGKAAWHEDARAGVTDMARRNEELRKRIHGKDVRNDSDEDSDVSSGADETDLDDEDEREALKLNRQLGRISGAANGKGPGSKLAAMAFMQKAEAAQKAQNDEDIERMRKELAGVESDQEEEEEEESGAALGRRKYGPTGKLPLDRKKQTRNEFEEADDKQDDEDGEHERNDDEVDLILDNGASHARKPQRVKQGVRTGVQNQAVSRDDQDTPVVNPWLAPPKKSKKSQAQSTPSLQLTFNGDSKKNILKNKKKDTEIVSAPDVDGWQTVSYGKDDDAEEEDDDDADSVGSLDLRNRELMQRAFAGDNAITDFEAEKKAIAEEEDEQVIDTTLAGWGSWTGDGLTVREQKHAQNRRVFKKQDGIKAAHRKDAKLERVIINEKRVRKNTKYLATQLPHEFESRQQYERSLRMPKGPEWSTTRTFGDNTKPRVLMKQAVILPPERPMA